MRDDAEDTGATSFRPSPSAAAAVTVAEVGLVERVASGFRDGASVGTI